MMATYLTFLDPDQLDALLRPFDPRTWLRRTATDRAAVKGRVDHAGSTRGPIVVSVASEVVEDDPAVA
jgi:hypothetical protein